MLVVAEASFSVAAVLLGPDASAGLGSLAVLDFLTAAAPPDDAATLVTGVRRPSVRDAVVSSCTSFDHGPRFFFVLASVSSAFRCRAFVFYVRYPAFHAITVLVFGLLGHRLVVRVRPQVAKRAGGLDNFRVTRTPRAVFTTKPEGARSALGRSRVIVRVCCQRVLIY